MTFIGPPPEVLELTGDKAAAVAAAREAGLPTLQESEATDDVDVLYEYAQGQKFPLFVKAVAGGGGRGDPFEREAELVARDVACGYVSREGAERDYGVVLAGDGVDEAATRAARMAGAKGGQGMFHFGPERDDYEACWTGEAYGVLTALLLALPIHWRFFAKTEIFRRIEGSHSGSTSFLGSGRSGSLAFFLRLAPQFGQFGFPAPLFFSFLVLAFNFPAPGFGPEHRRHQSVMAQLIGISAPHAGL